MNIMLTILIIKVALTDLFGPFGVSYDHNIDIISLYKKELQRRPAAFENGTEESCESESVRTVNQKQ